MKKIQRKAKQDTDKSPGDKDEKREKCIKQEPLSNEHSKSQCIMFIYSEITFYISFKEMLSHQNCDF